jgi:hypothetical protein
MTIPRFSANDDFDPAVLTRSAELVRISVPRTSVRRPIIHGGCVDWIDAAAQ